MIIGASRSSTSALLLHYSAIYHPDTALNRGHVLHTITLLHRDPGHSVACDGGTNQFRSRILVCFFYWREVELEPRKCRHGEHVENSRL